MASTVVELLRRRFEGGGGGSILPSGYTQLEYVQSTNSSSYIDTQIVPITMPKITAKVMLLALVDKDLVGLTSATSPRAFTINPSSNGWYIKYGTKTSGLVPYSMSANVEYDIELNDNGFYVGGNSVLDLSSFSKNFSSNTSSIRLGSGRSTYTKYRIYSAKIWDGNDLKGDFIPCKDTNNVIGLYDLVSQSFFNPATPFDTI